MARRDSIHQQILNALVKEGWIITADLFSFKTGGVFVDIDLAAKKLVIAERRDRKIVIEIKPFSGKSLITDFHVALGQYINYRGALKDAGHDMEIYLAISNSTYKRLSRAQFYGNRIKENEIRLIIVNIQDENIVSWIK